MSEEGRREGGKKTKRKEEKKIFKTSRGAWDEFREGDEFILVFYKL